jgi:hypothetical protein
LACVIGVVKYERVSDGRRSVPKLFRIDPADADTVESAARGIAVQGSLHGAGEAGAGGTEGTKKTTKKKGAAKGGSKGAGGGSSGDAGCWLLLSSDARSYLTTPMTQAKGTTNNNPTTTRVTMTTHTNNSLSDCET